jgi:hypothetical protein
MNIFYYVLFYFTSFSITVFCEKTNVQIVVYFEHVCKLLQSLVFTLPIDSSLCLTYKLSKEEYAGHKMSQ